MFQTGKELESVFHTEASFYKLETYGRTQLCRSLAAIRRIGSQTVEVDALFVLLNPGRCLPLAGEDSIPFISGGVDKLPLFPATPDNTLYQLMRLMERMNWNSVQIINLTDLRTGKFDEYKESQKFMKEHDDSRHSIFSVERRNELASYTDAAETTIAGWGTKSSIGRIAEEAYTVLSELGNINGLAYKSHPLYYHPFPWIQGKCIKWLDDMEAVLKEPVEVM